MFEIVLVLFVQFLVVEGHLFVAASGACQVTIRTPGVEIQPNKLLIRDEIWDFVVFGHFANACDIHFNVLVIEQLKMYFLNSNNAYECLENKILCVKFQRKQSENKLGVG